MTVVLRKHRKLDSIQDEIHASYARHSLAADAAVRFRDKFQRSFLCSSKRSLDVIPSPEAIAAGTNVGILNVYYDSVCFKQYLEDMNKQGTIGTCIKCDALLIA